MSKTTSTEDTVITVGLDLGDKHSSYCLVSQAGEVLDEGRIPTSSVALQRRFTMTPTRIIIEVGTHSPWISRLLKGLGHEVVVVDPRRLDVIARSDRKSDRHDASTLAFLGRMDPDLRLLRSVTHRPEEMQADLSVIRHRDALVRARTQLILTVRGTVKSAGGRLPACSAPAFARKVAAHIPSSSSRASLEVMLAQVESLTEAIKELDAQIVQLATQKYPETAALTQIKGVAHLTALTFVLTLADPQRFSRSRQVGVYLGLTPRQKQSGDRDPKLRITKAGDSYLRQLLVSAAHYILGPFGPDTDLRRQGTRLAARGDKRRAVVAIARKLAVLLHRLWVSGEVYEPLRLATRREHSPMQAA